MATTKCPPARVPFKREPERKQCGRALRQQVGDFPGSGILHGHIHPAGEIRGAPEIDDLLAGSGIRKEAVAQRAAQRIDGAIGQKELIQGSRIGRAVGRGQLGAVLVIFQDRSHGRQQRSLLRDGGGSIAQRRAAGLPSTGGSSRGWRRPHARKKSPGPAQSRATLAVTAATPWVAGSRTEVPACPLLSVSAEAVESCAPGEA